MCVGLLGTSTHLTAHFNLKTTCEMVPLLSPFYQQGHCGSERLRTLTKSIQQVLNGCSTW